MHDRDWDLKERRRLCRKMADDYIDALEALDEANAHIESQRLRILKLEEELYKRNRVIEMREAGILYQEFTPTPPEQPKPPAKP